MATYIMMGKYSTGALEGISSERSEKARGIIQSCNGKMRSAYSLLGEYDLIMTIDFPGFNEAMKASVALNMLSGISFKTSEAITTEEFDELVK